MTQRIREQAKACKGTRVVQKNRVNSQYRLPDSRIAAGSVSTHEAQRSNCCVAIC